MKKSLPRSTDQIESRVTVLTGRPPFAKRICEAIAVVGFETHACSSWPQWLAALEQGTAVAAFDYSQMPPEGGHSLTHLLDCQPTWSRLPLLIFLSDDESIGEVLGAWDVLSHNALPTILRESVADEVLSSSLRTAVMARTLQFRMRDEWKEQKRRERELRVTESLYEWTFAQAPVGIAQLGLDGQWLRFNEAFCHVTGFPRSELTALTPADIFRTRHLWGESVQARRLRYGEIDNYVVEEQCAKKDGNLVWLKVMVSMRRDETGAPLHEVWVVEDITQRKRAENWLRHVNEQLERRVVERTSELKMLCDIATMANTAEDVEAAIHYVLRRMSEQNDWACGHTWLPRNDAADTLISTYSHYQLADRRFERLRERMASLRIVTGEGIVGRVYAEGRAEVSNDLAADLLSHRAELLAGTGIQTAGAFPIAVAEKVVGVIEFFSEKKIELSEGMLNSMETVGSQLGRVIERMKNAQALTSNKERLELALAASSLGLWDEDLSSGAMTVDTRLTSMLEYAWGTIPPRAEAWNALVHSNDISRVKQARIRHLTGKTKSYSIEYRLRTASGSWKWVRSRGQVTWRDHDGQPLRLTGTLRDITERKRLEREIVESASAEQRRLGQELHDGIGGELTGIGFVLQGLIDDLRAEENEHVRTAARVGDELDRVTEQVRLLSRGLSPVDVDRLGLNDALEQLALRTTRLYGIPCGFRSDNAVQIKDSFVADHLYRVAQEAVTNAVKHARPQRIEIMLERYDEMVSLEVEDDGVGIEDDDWSKEGIGLRNMHYRAGLIGASLRVEPGGEQGTRVCCDCPSE